MRNEKGTLQNLISHISKLISRPRICSGMHFVAKARSLEKTFLLYMGKSNPLSSLVLVFISGVGAGLASMVSSFQYLGLVAYFPLLLVLDRIYQSQEYTWKRKIFYTLLACWGVGAIGATIANPWMIHSIHVFGHMPWGIAVLITGLVYGFEITLVLWVCFGFPMIFIKRLEGWDIPFRFCFFLLADPLYPRLFQWSFGGFVFTETVWIAQIADLVGDWGLGFYSIGFHFLLLLFWRKALLPASFNKSVAIGFTGVYFFLLVAGIAYGGWRTTQLESFLAEGEPLHIVAIQPNFSLQQLASNPDLAYSKRETNIRALLYDSQQALEALPDDSTIPKLLVWPESVYPFAYLKDPAEQKRIQRFVKRYQTALLFATIDWEETPTGYQFYGISLLIGSDGEIKGRYNKIFLIPFGEYIPGGAVFPAYRQWLKQLVPNISEFKRGDDFTVFQLADNLPFSGSICFDVFSPKIIRNMVRNGAQFVINLSNLAWFGKTNATRQMEMMIRWKAIENRVPFLYISNNGETMFINALGEKVGKKLELFEQGSLSKTILLQQYFSIYREYREWLLAGIFLVFLVITIYAQWKDRLFSAKLYE